MVKVNTYTIGSVRLSQLKGADIDSSRYSDGDSENILYEIFKSEDPKPRIKEIMSDSPPWPIYYHLSPFRKNVIDWYEFEEGSSVLEIGAGCGAITEVLCQKNVNVTALELTKRRAEINAYRNKDRSNLDIVIGNLEEYKPRKKFDYIVCVGVLEYAGIFISSTNPYDDFVKLLSGFLNDDGVLIIAIENRMGLKYLSGSREDHTGRFFDGINQYPHPKKVQTFGRVELKELIERNGFMGADFFYPHPDYKNPMVVYSDKYYPGMNADFPIKLLPTKSHDQQNRNRVHVFSEQLSMISVEKNLLFRDLANSFIVVAQKNSGVKNHEILYYTSTSNRKEEYNLNTYLKQDASGNLKFYKEAANQASLAHLKTIQENSTKLEQIFKNSAIHIVEAREIETNKLEFDFIDGITLERMLFDSIVMQDYQKALDAIDQFIETIGFLPGKITTNAYLIDLNFDNIIVDKDDKWNFIDYEWLLDKKVDKNVLIQRSLVYFINRYSPAFKHLTRRGDFVCVAKDWYMPTVFYDRYSKYFEDLSELSTNEKWFQTMVNENFSGHPVVDKQLNETVGKADASPGLIEEYLNNIAELKDQKAKIQDLASEQEKLKAELELQKEKTRHAELSSPYYLIKKSVNKLRRFFD